MTDTIPRSNLMLFNSNRKQVKSTKMKMSDLKQDANTFCKLYVASQNRETDIEDFFAHENSKYPPSISEFGRLRKPKNKSDMLECLEE